MIIGLIHDMALLVFIAGAIRVGTGTGEDVGWFEIIALLISALVFGISGIFM